MKLSRLLGLFALVCILLTATAVSAAMTGVDYLNASAKAEDPNEGIQLATKAIQAADLSTSDLAQAYFNRAYDNSRLKEYDVAIGDFTTAIHLKEGYWAAYNGRGECWRHKGEYKKAMDDYESALKLKSDYAFPYWNRSLIYEDQGRIDRALDDVRKFIQYAPDDPDGPARLKELEAKQ